jgi:nitric oxide reductase subunit B
MLALGLAMFSLRNIVDPRYWKERWMMIGFWGLNLGLMGMILITLVPVGVYQALESFRNGFWSARSWDFYQQPVIQTLLWLRMIPDSIFIFLGVLPLAAGAIYGLFHLRAERQPERVAPARETKETRELVEV